ncbi:MAG TPA: NapC/NirT family cytochrome c [bacterium]|nr:NapC/NirT family cytochrome c [bacterium]
MRRLFPPSLYNMVSMSGAALSVTSFAVFIFLFLIEITADHSNPYMGIFTFMVAPAFLILGLLMIAYGAWREKKRIARGTPSEGHLPHIDLNDPRHRRATAVFFFGTIILLGLSAFGSMEVLEYSDSVQFCGEVCHNVMHPEYTAYAHSPHARVPCAECHIGTGAEWFVKAKISGAYQVYSVLFNKFSKPIPTPIENLRPAQQTCEQCHWPRHFFSEKQRALTYYVSDENNTKWTLNLLMRIGGGNELSGNTDGIHWHMNIANEVDYVSTDHKRQEIPWVRIRDKKTGKETVYQSTENKISEAELKNHETRRMDCIDCHNRPSHKYNHPANQVNQYMQLGWIDPSLPYAKNISIKALEIPYTSTSRAMDSIAIVIRDFYSQNYPDISKHQSAKVDKAIQETQKIYSRNYFPEMRADWRGYPDNIGHMYAAGCFRCHDGKHKSDDGKVISRDCNVCHTLLAQKFENDKQEVSMQGLNYRHPVNVDKAWQEMSCYDCHNDKK